MSADTIIQIINTATERLRADQEREEASKKQQQQLQAKLDAGEKRISSLESKVKEDKRQISNLESQHALDKEQLEKNASEIERLTASQLSIREKAAKLKRELEEALIEGCFVIYERYDDFDLKPPLIISYDYY